MITITNNNVYINLSNSTLIGSNNCINPLITIDDKGDLTKVNLDNFIIISKDRVKNIKDFEQDDIKLVKLT